MCKSLLASSLAAAFAINAGTAFAQGAQAAPPADAAAATQELYLEVTLNSVRTGKLARFEIRDQQLYSDTATLKDIGLRIAAAGASPAPQMLALSSISGLITEYDARTQRVKLQAPVALLDAPAAQMEVAATRAARVDPEDQLRGLVVNYDLYGQQMRTDRNVTSLSAWTEMRLMGVASGHLGNTMITRSVTGLGDASNGSAQRGTVRLDTQWQRHFQDSMTSLTVGDAVTGGLSWTRPTRFGGIRLSRNFALQPYRVTTPLAQIQGEAALPSTVDLYLNGLRQSTQQVQPGQFTLGSIPTLSGLGNAQMVITDITGQQRTVNLPLYGASQLLQQGLADWSVELGSVREDYGIRSFSYRNSPMLSASGRYGLTNHLTLEGHAEADSHVRMLGAGGAWLLGTQGGVVSAALAASQYAGKTGQQATLGYQWSAPAWSAGFSSMRRNAAFRDVASVDGNAAANGNPLARGSDQIFLGANTDWGSFGAGYVAQASSDGTHARYANLSWSRQLSRDINLNLNAMRDLEGRSGTSLYVSMTIALERFLSASTTARHSGGQNSLVVGATQASSADTGGWGWRTEAGVGGSRYAQAQINQLGNYGQWSAGVMHQAGSNGGGNSSSAYASANGGLLWTHNRLYPMRTATDGFALVTTDGIANVPIRLENRVVGQTNDKGYLLVDRLNAYQRNLISIDTLSLAPDLKIDRVQADAVPQYQGGVLARFAMRHVSNLQITLKDQRGEFLPAGGDALLESDDGTAKRPVLIGYDGLVYVEDAPANARLRARTASGVECVASLPSDGSAPGWKNLGELICRDVP
ncbi:fimbria/pilus outer membrane usher protein [Diaphorobacter caeni]|uniref:fimbria/pilus outer membrane usher protein n=1 Tax=Diaphorobacter caeni TaxID=2784387 RepID=UPI00188F4C7C|nr:fimbria/pilus outer membrane usher protein [Diaphorobacter caeni]MBF5004657.1 fimbrial biogenesis outer membrane usher protein [Diaphorobacter caeni]